MWNWQQTTSIRLFQKSIVNPAVVATELLWQWSLDLFFSIPKR